MYSSSCRLLLLIFLMGSFVSCKKTAESYQNLSSPNSVNRQTNNLSITSSSSGCAETLEPSTGADSVSTQTILGSRLLNNPYSVTNMQQASVNLYGNSVGISSNKTYIRFKPANTAQLEQLDNLDLDLYDYPLDYEVIQEGDFYDQGLPTEEIPWFYTVVDPSFTPPAGIQYEILGNLYVPSDDVYLEDEAFRITGNAVDTSGCSTQTSMSTQSVQTQSTIICRQQHCPEGYIWNSSLCQCVLNTSCPTGYHWDGTTCVPNTPPPPPVSSQPLGRILVHDNAIGIGGSDVAVRRTRIVLKRFLKIDRTYTDDNGNFVSNKHFRNKVDIVVKFKNNSIRTTSIRGAGYWQMFFPVKHGIGKYKGNLNSIPPFVFTEPSDRASRGYRNWWAAQLMNANAEYSQMATALGTGQLPSDLRVVLTNWRRGSGGGSTVMNYHRNNETDPPREFLEYFIADPQTTTGASILNNIQGGYFHYIDISLGYRVNTAWTSDHVKALMYHEMSHAAHFQKVGQQWWNSLVYAEEFTIKQWRLYPDLVPYGNGTDGTASEYISLAESWAEHLARVMCDRAYGANSRLVLGYTRNYNNDDPVQGLSSHLNYLEDYDPNDLNNPFHWIPEGLYYDLFDVRNEQAFPIADGVQNFSNGQMFSALEADVNSMPQYRERLIGQNPNSQTNEVRNLFNQYHY
jgi:hypothetical protein